MAVADKDILYRVAYEEAVRALSEQQGEIDSFRTRAGLLFSSAMVATSFLGPSSFDDGSLPVFSWLALATFTATATISLAILWPHPWELSASSRDVVKNYVDS